MKFNDALRQNLRNEAYQRVTNRLFMPLLGYVQFRSTQRLVAARLSLFELVELEQDMSTIAVIVGNPSPQSRTRVVAEDLAKTVAQITGSTLLETIDLAEYSDRIFSTSATDIDELARQVATSDYAVFATPTYKASYTGLLKAFLDRYQSKGLADLIAFPVFTIGSASHALAVEFTLRPLLVELGASVPTAGLAFETSEFDKRTEILDQWVEQQKRSIPRR